MSGAGCETSALVLADELLTALRAAREEAGALADALRRLDREAVHRWSEERVAARERILRLEAGLRRALPAGPRPEALAARLAAIRREAAALRTLDADNAARVERTLRCVRGFVRALAPAPEAYDRRGLARAGGAR